MDKTKYLFIFMAAAALTGCGHHHDEEGHDHGHEGLKTETAGESHDDEHHHGANEVVFSHEQQEAAGLQTMKATLKPCFEVVKTSGVLRASASGECVVAAPVSGIVTFADKNLCVGKDVSAGNALFLISSATMEGGSDRATTAVTELKAATRDYANAKQQYADKLITKKEFTEAENRYQAALAAISTSGAMASGKGKSVSPTLSGKLTMLNVQQGQYVEAGQQLGMVSRTGRMMLKIDVPVRYRPILFQKNGETTGGLSAAFVVPYMAPKTFVTTELNGKLIAIGTSTEGNSGYIPVTFEIDNTQGFASGTIVETYLRCGTVAEGIQIPVSAVTEEQGIYYVYVREDDHAFSKTEVIVGQSDGVNIVIKSGLQDGDEVVTVGATHLKLASNTGAIPEGHSHNH